MFIVMPSDPATTKASEYLEQQGITHLVMPIPEELGYKSTATMGIYIRGTEKYDEIMLDMSAQGLVIMRVFKSYELC